LWRIDRDGIAALNGPYSAGVEEDAAEDHERRTDDGKHDAGGRRGTLRGRGSFPLQL
jgi:hypothetical protein